MVETEVTKAVAVESALVIDVILGPAVTVSDFVEAVTPESEALHQLPTLKPSFSVHVDSSPPWLEKVTRPVTFT